MRKHRDIKLVTTERKKNFLLSQSKYYTTKFFTKSLLVIEMKKAKITMNKPDYFYFLVSELSKTAMYDFWYNYIKPKYGKKAKPFFYRCKQLHCPHKNKRYLQRYCRRC